MSRRRAILLVAATALGLSNAAQAESNPAYALLLQQAQYWRERNRPDLAQEALDRLLASDPDNLDALSQLAIFEAETGHGDAAQRHLDRVRQLSPNDPRIAQIQSAIRFGLIDDKMLAQARADAQAGKVEAAVQDYQRVFKGRTPPPSFALEYYMTLAGIKDGWDEAETALARLAAGPGASTETRLAYARTLTYRDVTRAQGIERLVALSHEPTVAHAANEAWRQAILWLGDTPQDRDLISAYLTAHPDDSTIEAKIEEARRQAAANAQAQVYPRLRTEGYDDLNRGDLAGAQQRFEAVLANRPEDADALAGLGIIKLRQGDFAGAESLLGRAVSLAPEHHAQWDDALASARFWDGMERAKAVRRGDPAQAEQILRQLVKSDRPERVYADLLLADVLEQRGEWREAEAEYRQLHAAYPHNSDISVSLYFALVKNGKPGEAAALADGFDAATRQRVAGSFARTRGEAFRTAAQHAGDSETAAADYARAIAAAPDDPWIRLDYARFLVRNSRAAAGDSLIDTMVDGPHVSVEALQAGAIYYGERGNNARALGLIDRVPPAHRSADLVALRNRVVATQAIDQATALARAGRVAEAQATLDQLAAAGTRDPAQALQVALALADVGETTRALAFARSVYQRQTHPDGALTMQYVAVLLRTGQEAEAAAIMRNLAPDASLSSEQRRTLAHLQAVSASKAADDAAKRGDYAGAYDILAPQLNAATIDTQVLLTLAGLYMDAKRPHEAYDIYARVLTREPANLDALSGAIGAAIDLKSYDTATKLAERALQVAPNSARFNYLAGEIARLNGDDETALHYLETAQSLHQREVSGQPPALPASGPTGGPQHVPGNPFRSPSSSAAPASGATPLAEIPLEGRPVQLASAEGVGPARTPAPMPASSAASDPARAQTAAQGGGLYYPPPAYAPPPSYPPPPPAYAAPPATPYSPPIPAVSAPQPDPLGQQIESSLAEIREEVSPAASGEVGVRLRSGEPGLSRLVDLDAPVTGSVTPGFGGHLTATIQPVFLEAGTVSTDPGVQRRIGSGALGLLAIGSVNDQGVAGSVGYQRDWFEGNVGVTPAGFDVGPNVTGSLRVRVPMFDGYTQLRLAGFRQSVNDSVVSYAGFKDPSTGVVFGGVLRNAGRIELAHDDGYFGDYVNGTFSYYTGTHVANNNSIEVGGGAYVRPYKTDTQELKVGVNLTYLNYNKNEDFFTIGHGGYFSPQNFVDLSLPVDWTGRNGRYTWILGGALGVQTFDENSALYFPIDPARQAALLALAAGNPAIQTVYPSQSKTGVSGNLHGDIGYQITPYLRVGGRASFDAVGNFNEESVRLYFKQVFPVD